MPYFHVVFTLPGPVADIAYQNKSVVYDLLLKTAAETTQVGASQPIEGSRKRTPEASAAC